MIRIGIITPTYMYAELLSRALFALQRITYKEWEVYVVDDGSSKDMHAK